MQLGHKTIPKEFLNSLPEGIKYVVKNGKDFLVVEQLFCPEGHSLMVNNVRMHGESSIRLKVKLGKSEGNIFVDAFWGSHDKLYSFMCKYTDEDLMEEEVCCPTCGCSLIVENETPCEVCGSIKSIELILPGINNKILVCAKVGCPQHKLIAKEVSPKISEIVSDINYFGL